MSATSVLTEVLAPYRSHGISILPLTRAVQYSTTVGCAGNLNNFATVEDCETFCTDGVESEFFVTHHDDVAANIETYELGFSLTGPLIPHAARKRAQQSLADFLSQKFSLPRTSIREVFIMDDNTARFTVKDSHASAYAKQISNAVNTGMEFPLNGNYYRAEPHTWFAHQIAEPMSSSRAQIAFWVLLVCAIIFAVLVCASLFGTCAYLYHSTRAKNTDGNTRASSPSNVVSDSIFASRTRQRPHLREEPRFPSNATTRSVRSIPLIPSISIERPRRVDFAVVLNLLNCTVPVVYVYYES
ncbi:Kunitz/Bovine pancreatic trypsin inhibitor domain protein [Oesophagostomum dentatum]|uniref:Kunitz/Bovine pancreatic trypsin inhibitor domain protein n=1 Tax=Oesophagostomum dentatum TaxID=61180 RepID=A0A0B1S459_OESDE|nr:Kunitz/Bovine pancreatic trypsin inhibitor domain protein [Oesophagostomum dentatum]